MSQIRFARGLAEKFVAELSNGCLRNLMVAATGRQLDVQIREHSVDFFARGRCVLNLEHNQRNGSFRARIHVKFLKGVHWASTLVAGQDNYCRFGLDACAIANYIADIDCIIGNAVAEAEPEATVEEELIRASNKPGSPLVFFDRQVQLHGVRKRMDLIGVTTGLEPKIVLTELKQGLDNRIQELMDHVGPYRELIAPDGYLREDVFRFYVNVLAQKKRLGLIPYGISIPEGRPPAECLIVLYGYNERSKLLDRLEQAAQGHGSPMWLVLLPDDEFDIPPTTEWRRMA